MSHLCQGDYEPALAEVRKIRSLDPDSVFAIILEGIIAHCRGDFSEAEKKYLDVLKTEEYGYHLYVRVALATLNAQKGRRAEARNHFEQGLALADKAGDNWWRAVYHVMLSVLEMESGRPESAIRECDATWKVAERGENDLRWRRRALFGKGLAALEAGSRMPPAGRRTSSRECVMKG